jgi:hypothetical protein
MTITPRAEAGRRTGRIAVADPTLAHTRDEAPRLLMFTSEGVTIDLEMATEDGIVRLLGRLDPPRATEIRVE